jgi:hypothetical protein
MRTSFIVLAVILGCAIAQSAGTNYCSAKGTFCSLCIAAGNNKSCTACGKLAVSKEVAAAVGSFECVAATAANCSQALQADATKCAVCNTGFALKADSNTCEADATKIADCMGLAKDVAGKVTCQACQNSKTLSVDKTNCTVATTDKNCYSAFLPQEGAAQLCISCNKGFAYKTGGNPVCDQSVSGDLTGCARVTADGKTCDNLCNGWAGFWMTDVNKCTAFASIATAAFALIASFFFSN